jgi:hypothetical protein
MRSDPVSPEPAASLTDTVQIQRRTLLALVLAAPSLAWATHALAAEASTPAADDKFLALSRFATGRSSLDPALGTAVLAALRDSDPALGSGLDELAAAASSGSHADVEALEVAVRDTPRHAALLALVSAWYTGTVTVDGKPRVLFVTDALMYQPTADGSHIPGSCAGATNSWAERTLPPLDPMPAA